MLDSRVEFSFSAESPPSGSVICVDFGGSAIRVALETNGDFSEPLVEDIVAGSELEIATNLVNQLISQDTGLPSALSVAVPGVVDFATHTMIRAHEKYASLDGINLKHWFQRRWDLPFAIENDARAALLGEISTGVAAESSNVVLVILGTGIGTAAIVNGVVVRGHSGHGGILGGHITMDFDGDACPCGNIGCAELLASTWALQNPGSEMFNLGIENIKHLVEGSEVADSHAVVVLDRFIRVWSSTIVSLCHLFDPQVVVITGNPMKSSKAILPKLTDRVGRQLWSSLPTPRIVVPPDPELSVFRGLAYLAHTQSREVSR